MNGQHGDNHFWFSEEKVWENEQKFHCFHGNTFIFIFAQETKQHEEDCDRTQTELLQEQNRTKRNKWKEQSQLQTWNSNYHKFNRVWNRIGTIA